MPQLRQWVEQNSYSGNVDGVNAVGSMLIEAFDLPGLSVERRAGNGVGDHLCWRTAAWERAQPSERTVMIGHHDTVFPPGAFDVWEEQGERLRGPGVLDMKGGLLVIRTAMASLADAGGLADLPLAVISVGDEEIGSADSRSFVEEIVRGAGAALVFEAGRADDSIVIARKGTGKFQVEVKGVAAHAGNHHADGVSAIRALARFIDGIEAMTDYERGVTVNVGLVSGGTSANTVPAQANCAIDFRFIRAADGEDLVRNADRLAREIAGATNARFAIGGGIRRQPLEPTDASRALFHRYADCARTAGLDAGECPLIGGGSDANTASAIGVPAIDGLGPRGRGFHTPDEYIEVATLPQRIEALIRLLAAS